MVSSVCLTHVSAWWEQALQAVFPPFLSSRSPSFIVYSRLKTYFFPPLCHPGNTPSSLAPASYSASLRDSVTHEKEFQAMLTVAIFLTVEIRDWKILLAHPVHYFTF